MNSNPVAKPITQEQILSMQSFCAHEQRGIVPQLINKELSLTKSQADKLTSDFSSRFTDTVTRGDAAARMRGVPEVTRRATMKEHLKCDKLFRDLVQLNTKK